MKKSILIVSLAAIFAFGEDITLSKIITYMRVHHPYYKALEEESLALDAKVKAEYSKELSSLGVSATRAKPDGEDSGNEYGVSLSTPIDVTGGRRVLLESGDLENEAILLDKQKELFAFGNRVRNLYHQSCLDKEELILYKRALRAFNSLYRKKTIAYKYKEISKKELLQIELERNLLVQQVKSLRDKYETSKSALLNLTDIPKDYGKNLECRDLFPIKERIEIDNEPFILTNLSYRKKREALKKKYLRYKKFLDPISLSVNYDKEVDAKKVGLGVEIPLGFTSQRNEQNRIYYLRELNVLDKYHAAWFLEANAKKEKLFSNLKSDYNLIKALKENIKKYENALMPLVEKSFQVGESSVIEYILSRRKLLDMSVELLKSKKSYYENLFNLYTLVETER